MATLVQVKTYFQVGKHGRPCPMSEIKKLTEDDRKQLCEELDKLTEEERAA